jgi:hypothetical protein
LSSFRTCKIQILSNPACSYTRSYSKGKIADDLNIISLLAEIVYPGQIRLVFTINNGELHLLVAYVTSVTLFTFEIDKKGNLIYANICSIVGTEKE